MDSGGKATSGAGSPHGFLHSATDSNFTREPRPPDELLHSAVGTGQATTTVSSSRGFVRSADASLSSSRRWISLEEWTGSSRTAVLTASSTSFAVTKYGSRWRQLWGKLLGAFVPEGFPSSVTPDYVQFQIWDTLQGLSTYIRAMLSTQALLGAIGVGEQSATVIGATFQWFLRDFTGMLGGICFTFYKGSSLDSDAKMWRLVADFMNDLGMLMDLLSPLYPSVLMIVMCAGSLSRAFTGVASGATRAALTQHFALANNAADISAKEGSQETVATMAGMVIGMLLAHFTRGHPLIVWMSFLLLTAFHMYANYRAVRCLSLTTLNLERCSILLRHFLHSGGGVLTPQQVSREEHILPFHSCWRKLTRDANMRWMDVHLGARASSLSHSDMMELAGSAISAPNNANYLLLEKKREIYIFIHRKAMPADVLKAYIHGLLVTQEGQGFPMYVEDSQQWILEQYPVFIAKLQSRGWFTERLLSPSIHWRANWTQDYTQAKN